MRDPEVEGWVLRIIRLIEAGYAIEDGRVELKREWPDPVGAARRMAGHCNASSAPSVLWVIGLDEMEGPVPFQSVDLAVWWPQVEKNFDQVSPTMRSLVVPVGDHAVTALLIDAARAPYVVRNPSFGGPNGGPVQREVPWRDGTRVRTARRDDLMRILAPRLRLPEVEILSAQIRANAGPVDQDPVQGNVVPRDPPEFLEWRLQVTTYLAPRGRERVVIPCHRSSIAVHTKRTGLTVERRPSLTVPKYSPRPLGMFDTGEGVHVDSHTMLSTSSELIVDGPGVAEIHAVMKSPVVLDALRDAIEVRVSLAVIDAEDPIKFGIEIESPPGAGRWDWEGL